MQLFLIAVERNWARLLYPKLSEVFWSCGKARTGMQGSSLQKSGREKHQAKYFPSRGILNTWKIERLNTGKVGLKEELIQGSFLLLCFHVLVLG